jgi:hypothetical protein
MTQIPAADLPLTTAVAKALVRVKMKRMAIERGVDVPDDYLAGTVDRLWDGTDATAEKQRSHYLELATVAIQEVRGYLQVPRTPPGTLPAREWPILESTAVPHQQTPTPPPSEVKPLTAPAYKGHPGMKGFAHPVDTFLKPTEPKPPVKDA